MKSGRHEPKVRSAPVRKAGVTSQKSVVHLYEKRSVTSLKSVVSAPARQVCVTTLKGMVHLHNVRASRDSRV